jgi:hypothetical protein
LIGGVILAVATIPFVLVTVIYDAELRPGQDRRGAAVE